MDLQNAFHGDRCYFIHDDYSSTRDAILSPGGVGSFELKSRPLFNNQEQDGGTGCVLKNIRLFFYFFSVFEHIILWSRFSL